MSDITLNKTEHVERITLFAEVIVPAPIPKLFTYRVPFEYNEVIEAGQRAIIQFGRKKILTGVINEVHDRPPKSYEAKYLLEILDDQPSLVPQQLRLIQWCASYYMSTPGEVLTVALPSGLKLSSQSFVQLNPDYDGDVFELSPPEQLIMDELERQSLLSYDEVSNLTDTKNVYKLLQSLVAKQAILLIEQVKEKYQPRLVKRIRLTATYNNQEALQALFKEIEKRPKQTDLLLFYLKEVPIYNHPEKNTKGIEKSSFKNKGLSISSLNSLIKKEVLEEFTEKVSRLETSFDKVTTATKLSSIQEQAKNEIIDHFQEKEVVLLHGITGSGKTEIYIELMKEAVEGGGQVLYMLPEIALTTQIVRRLRSVFGERLGIYHSKYSDNERVEVWQQLLLGKYDIVVGVRSSVFLPFSHLSLVIVDEEHESSYKQFEQAPRYHARDTAIVLAGLHDARTLLGSATPSFETYHNALEGKYGLVKLLGRYGDARLPEIQIADLAESRKRKTIKAEFTPALLEGIQNAITADKQAIVFQNRRGYSPFMSCDECAHVPKCQNCSVSLTYHMYDNMLKCHYCGFKEKAPTHCSSCGSTRLRTVGFGTEKIEEDLKLLLPEVSIERMDLDTTRSKYGYQHLIDKFEKQEIDVLVGTQMVTKGLDFDHVQLVGVMDLDRMLHFPDFRSSERCFQLVIQVSGRAGRRKESGTVIVQTTDPHQPMINHLIQQDYDTFYHSEIKERRSFKYPPFYRLIRVVLKHRDQAVVQKTADVVAMQLKDALGDRVLGPKEPFINKIRNYFHMEVLIKLEKTKIKLPEVKELIQQNVSGIHKDRELRTTIIHYDVDPF